MLHPHSIRQGEVATAVVDEARKRSTRLEKERGKEGESEIAGVFVVKVNVCLTR